jgi:hypothetical protein
MDMPMRKHLAPLCLALAALPASAQAFPDSPAFGGSKVFSLGLNPLGNTARFDQALPGWYLGTWSGDLKPKDQTKALDALAGALGGDTFGFGGAFARLNDNPWALRDRSFGLVMAQTGGVHGSITRQEMSSLLASPDQDPAHRGSTAALALNATSFDLRRSVVSRVVLGAGSIQEGVAYGYSLRLEDWRLGQATAALNPLPGQLAIGDPKTLLDFKQTDRKVIAATVDVGAIMELTQGIRLGGMVDRLVPRTIGDVKEQPQARVGLQLDLGSFAQFGVESDLNEAARMPYVAKQRTMSASLRIAANPTVQLLLGGERRTLAGLSTQAYGATLFIRAGSFLVGAGMQIGQDRPLVGFGVKIQ